MRHSGKIKVKLKYSKGNKEALALSASLGIH
jgi:hypothetical protein